MRNERAANIALVATVETRAAGVGRHFHAPAPVRKPRGIVARILRALGV